MQRIPPLEMAMPTGKALPGVELELPETLMMRVYSQNPTFIYTQGTAARDWDIVHNLNKYPSITVADSAGTVVLGEAEYISQNEVILHFSAPFVGTAYLN